MAIKEHRWAQAGKALSVIATLLGIVWATSNLSKVISPHEANLSAEVTYSVFDIPSIYLDGVYQIKRPISLPPRIDGVWYVKIVNKGSKIANGVKLFLPNAISAKIKREGSGGGEQRVTETILIGDVTQGETIEVLAWTEANWTPVLGHVGERIRLNYSDGVGAIVVHRPVMSFLYFVDKYWLLIVMVPILVLATIFLIYAEKQSSKKLKATKKEPVARVAKKSKV